MAKTNVKGLLTNPYTISLRLDGRTYGRVKSSAEQNFRSVAAEINYRLKKSFDPKSDQGRAPDAGEAA
jgi:hypothetical protein